MTTSIKKPILGLLVAAFAVLLVVVIASTLWMHDDQGNAILRYPINAVVRQIAAQKQREVLFLSSQLETIARIEAIQQAFLSRDRAALLQASLPINRVLLENNQVTHFYFHDGDGVNFLRVHKPDQFGDLIDRHTLRRAQQTATTSSGVEMGPLGTMTLRVVMPWRLNGTIVGYLELGREISHIISAAQDQLGFALYTFIDKTRLDRRRWPDWDRFPELVYTGQAQLPPEITAIFDRYLASGKWRNDVTEDTVMPIDTGHSSILYLFSVPIFDISNQVIGRLFSTYDDQGVHNTGAQHAHAVIATSLMLVSVLFVIFAKMLARIEQKIGLQTAQVAQSHRQNQLLLAAAGEGISGVDRHGYTTFINAIGASMVGWDPGELIGRDHHALLHYAYSDGTPHHREQCHVHDALRDGIKHHASDEVFWRKDGSCFPVEYTVAPVMDEGSVLGAVVIFRDISDRVRSEQQSQRYLAYQGVINQLYEISYQPIQLQQQLEVALDLVLSIPWLVVQSKGAIFLADPETGMLQLTTQKGLNSELLLLCQQVPFGHCLCGRAARDKVIVHANCVDDRHEIHFSGMLPHGHYSVPILLGELLLGVLTLYLEAGHPYHAEETNLLQAIGHTLGSMIHRKTLEESLQSQNVLLEEKVHERTLELEDYVESLKQAHDQLIRSERLAALGDMVAGISHEIKTPVGIGYTATTHLETATDRFVQLYRHGDLRREALDNYLDEVVESTRLIKTNISRAAELILSFKNVAVDQTSQERRRFNLKEYLTETLISLGPKLKKTPHLVTMSCPDDIELDSFPGALSQIITNLVINSLTYGICDHKQGKININVSVDDNTIVLYYQDDGCGMSEQTLKRLYEPFFTTNR
ncbi:MAG: GAF domain-containing protein, partial [Magnetococcales bacterium]|nr:GAF domain-containing protein [Magnetococcales bacterium]